MKKRGESSKIEFSKHKTKDKLVATCNFHIAMNFGSTYIGSPNQGVKNTENACVNRMWQLGRGRKSFLMIIEMLLIRIVLD